MDGYYDSIEEGFLIKGEGFSKRLTIDWLLLNALLLETITINWGLKRSRVSIIESDSVGLN